VQPYALTAREADARYSFSARRITSLQKSDSWAGELKNGLLEGGINSVTSIPTTPSALRISKSGFSRSIAEWLGDTTETVAKHYLPISTAMSESTRNILDRDDAGIDALRALAPSDKVTQMKSNAA
jgi:hypothetical protein